VLPSEVSDQLKFLIISPVSPPPGKAVAPEVFPSDGRYSKKYMKKIA